MQQLEASDAIIRNRNQEIATPNARLAGKDEIIAEAGEQIENLEFELASGKNKSSATTGKDLSEIEAADILNTLKSQRKKSKADLADIKAILEILEEV